MCDTLEKSEGYESDLLSGQDNEEYLWFPNSMQKLYCGEDDPG